MGCLNDHFSLDRELDRTINIINAILKRQVNPLFVPAHVPTKRGFKTDGITIGQKARLCRQPQSENDAA